MTAQAVKILKDIEDEKVCYEEQELVDALYAATLRDDINMADRLLQVCTCRLPDYTANTLQFNCNY